MQKKKSSFLSNVLTLVVVGIMLYVGYNWYQNRVETTGQTNIPIFYNQEVTKPIQPVSQPIQQSQPVTQPQVLPTVQFQTVPQVQPTQQPQIIYEQVLVTPTPDLDSCLSQNDPQIRDALGCPIGETFETGKYGTALTVP